MLPGRSVMWPCLRNFGDQPAIRPEQQPRLAVDDAGVQVRRRHRRGAQRREAVHLGPVARGDRRVGGTQELPAHREAAVALGLLDAGLLKQRKRVAARTDEDEPRVDPAHVAGAAVAHLDRPGAVGLAGQVADLLAEQRSGAVAHAVADELLGQRAEVDVGAVGGPVQGDRIGEVALGRHERQPPGELVRVVDELGGGEQRVGGQRVPALAQVVDAVGTVHEATRAGPG